MATWLCQMCGKIFQTIKSNPIKPTCPICGAVNPKELKLNDRRTT